VRIPASRATPCPDTSNRSQKWRFATPNRGRSPTSCRMARAFPCAYAQMGQKPGYSDIAVPAQGKKTFLALVDSVKQHVRSCCTVRSAILSLARDGQIALCSKRGSTVPACKLVGMADPSMDRADDHSRPSNVDGAFSSVELLLAVCNSGKYSVEEKCSTALDLPGLKRRRVTSGRA
jgi:hypothetical protein